MILIFKLIILTSVWVLGWTIVTQKDMALHKIRVAAERKSSLWYEPLILCHWCMPSIHSLFGYGFAILLGIINVWSWSLVFMYPLVVMGSSLLCGLTWAAYVVAATSIRLMEHKEKLAHYDVKNRVKEYNKSHGKSPRNSRTGVQANFSKSK